MGLRSALLTSRPAEHCARAEVAGAAAAMLLPSALRAPVDGWSSTCCSLVRGWFVGLGVDDPLWDASTFSRNRGRLLAGEVAQRFLAELLALPEVKRLLSSEHVSLDGTLLQAWASQKSFRRKDGEDEPPGAGPQWRAGVRRTGKLPPCRLGELIPSPRGRGTNGNRGSRDSCTRVTSAGRGDASGGGGCRDGAAP
jgi:hypothetical protein